jgi:multisubunit Na+/H+ antiporter MnhE subunit
VIVSVGPDWLGSPQHFVVGAIAAMVVFAAARSRWIRLPEWVAFVLAVSLVSTAEFVLELIEYPLLYADQFPHSAYYETLADMASSIVGAIVGGVVAAIFTRPRVASPGSASGVTA